MNLLQTILEEKCNALLAENEILFAGIISKTGKLVSGGAKLGVKLVEESEKEMLFMQHVLMSTMNNDFDGGLGRALYTVTKREKMTMIYFTIDSSLFMIAIEPAADIRRTMSKIQRIIKKESLI